ncbi:ATP-dependent RecD-like DNA helicase [Mycoplasmopsis agassizii]|uniref:ATP-dependent DNA helicase n=1 Tax=Mycoplasmopsis agassizii TaxID=33922 RepID=UPI0035277586
MREVIFIEEIDQKSNFLVVSNEKKEKLTIKLSTENNAELFVNKSYYFLEFEWDSKNENNYFSNDKGILIWVKDDKSFWKNKEKLAKSDFDTEKKTYFDYVVLAINKLRLIKKEEVSKFQNKEVKNLLKYTGLSKYEEDFGDNFFFLYLRAIRYISNSIKRNFFSLNNPYKLKEVFPGSFWFADLDKFYLDVMWGDFDSDLRRFEVINNSLQKLERNNDTILKKTKIIDDIRNNHEVEFDENDDIFHDLLSKKIIIQIDDERVTRSETYKKEMFIYHKIKQISESKNNSILWGETSNNNFYSKAQKEAITKSLEKNFWIISGFPGTGKSTIIKEILNQVLDERLYSESEIAIVTPTGKASSQLSQKINYRSKTIHSFFDLLAKEDEDEFDYGFVKFLIIDEFSMVELNVLYDVLEKLDNLEKIVFVGDENQLPAIGSGNLMQDLINLFPDNVSKLKENFRSKTKQDIFEFFNHINNSSTDFKNLQNVFFVESIDDELFETLIDIYINKTKDTNNFDKEIIIPLRNKDFGSNKFNELLDERIKQEKDDKDILILNKRKFSVGDKVMQMVNDYDRQIFNGEIGKIVKIIKDEKKPKNEKIIVDFFKEESKIELTKNTRQALKNLEISYANTVHKYQGSETETVIFPVSRQYAFMNEKKLLYTALSRAKEKIILVGDLNYFLNNLIPNLKDKIIETNLREKYLKERGKKWN